MFSQVFKRDIDRPAGFLAVRSIALLRPNMMHFDGGISTFGTAFLAS